MIAINISIESLASMLADAHQEGWNKGHDMIPSDPRETFLEYHGLVEGMCEEIRH